MGLGNQCLGLYRGSTVLSTQVTGEGERKLRVMMHENNNSNRYTASFLNKKECNLRNQPFLHNRIECSSIYGKKVTEMFLRLHL